MSYSDIVKVDINLSTKPTLPKDYHKFVSSKGHSGTLEAYKYACELSLVYKEIGNGIVYLILDNMDEVPYLPTFHTYEDDQGNLEFVTEHHVDFTKNIKLCEHRLCLWYSDVEDREIFEYNMKGSLWKW